MRFCACVLLLVTVMARAGSTVPTLPPLPPGAIGPSSYGSVSSDASVATMQPLPAISGSRIDLRFVPVAQVIDLIYADMLQIAYVIAPEVLADARPVSFRFDRREGDIRPFMKSFLSSLGYTVSTRDSVDYISKASSADDTSKDSYIYEPRYRNADYLSRIVQPLFSGRFSTNREISAPDQGRMTRSAPAGSAASMIDQSSDTLLFVGTASEIASLKKLLPQIDTPVGQVAVRAWVYEVSNQSDSNSAFQLAVKLFGGRVGASLGTGAVGAGAGTIRLSAGGLEAAVSALNSDSRFRVVTSPNLRVRSGQQARLNVGQSVPVVGAVSYPSSSGAMVQSVQYQDAGVIFQVQPTVRSASIDLSVVEEISDFVKTTTGVNNSPTKNTRKLESSFSLDDGDAVLIGGLSQEKSTRLESGFSFLPSWMNGHGIGSGRTEILLLLQVQRL